MRRAISHGKGQPPLQALKCKETAATFQDPESNSMQLKVLLLAQTQRQCGGGDEHDPAFS